VAFTSVGSGAENDFKPFFSQELAAEIAPQNVTVTVLPSTSSASVRVTWIPLTLFEAKGFPVYTVTLTLSRTVSIGKRQTTISVTTSNSFVVIDNLMTGVTYIAEVAVVTGTNSSTPTMPQTSDPVRGNVCGTKMFSYGTTKMQRSHLHA